MTQTIIHKRSATQGKVPTTLQLSLGEISINTYDGKIYIKKSDGVTESIVDVGLHPDTSSVVSANNSGITYIQDLTFDGMGHVTAITSAAIRSASTTQSGVVQLNDSIGSNSSTEAATAGAVKLAYDAAQQKLPLAGGTLTGPLTLFSDPIYAMEAASKQYVDNAINGLDVKQSVRVASTANVNISSPGTAIDGVTLSTGNRVLLKNQTTQSQNGIYEFNTSTTAMTRTADADDWAEFQGSFTFVEEGTTNKDTGWVCTVDATGTLGTTAITWSQFSGVGSITSGTGISVTGNQVSLATLANSGVGSFLKITRDSYGRVSGTEAVDAADVTGLSGFLSSTAGAALGTAAVGTSTTVARSDHVHAMPSLDALSNTTFTSKANNDAVLWDSASSQWKNVPVYTKTYIDGMTIDGGAF